MAKKLVSITPHSTEQGPLDALDATLAHLPAGGKLRRDESGLVAVNDGRVLCECGDAGFVVFAVTAQGYARAAEVVPANPAERLDDAKLRRLGYSRED